MLLNLLIMNRNKLLLMVAVFIVICVARFWRLSEIPTAFVHDELIYLIQARAVAFTGSNIAGTWNPVSLVPFNSAFAELPSVFLALTVPRIADPMLAGRVLHSLMGLSIAFLLGSLAHGIWKDQKLSLITVVIGLLNPWLWQFSRMPFDPLFSIFFYFSGAAVLFHFRSWWKLLAIPLLFLGFFQYQGHKLSFIPFVLCLIILFMLRDGVRLKRWYLQTIHPQTIWISAMVALSCCSLFIFYIAYSLPKQQASVRMSQIRMPSSNVIQTIVNTDRRLTLDSPLVQVANNKYTETVRGITDSFLKANDLSFLFLSANEPANSFNVSKHGYFYLLDLPLILLGIYALTFKRNQRLLHVSYLFFVMACTLPNLLSFGQAYTFRSSLFYMLLIPLIANGLLYVYLKKNVLLSGAITLLYLASFISFLYQYNVQYPVYAADANLFSERVISSYMNRISKDRTIYIVVPDEEFVLHSYLYYNGLYNADTAEQARNAVEDKSYIFQNLHIVVNCDDVPTNTNAVIIAARSMEYCPDMPIASPSARLVANPERIISVPAVVDSGELFRIYHDPVCKPYTLTRYIMPKRLENFGVERLSDDQFCTNWFSNVHE